MIAENMPFAVICVAIVFLDVLALAQNIRDCTDNYYRWSRPKRIHDNVYRPIRPHFARENARYANDRINTDCLMHCARELFKDAR